MTRLEERHYDRTCVNEEDPCKELKRATQQALADALIKMNDMLRDKGGMFGTSKWDTHAAGLQGRLDNISAMISLGQKLGCDMSAEIAIFANLSMPRMPK
ncbi:hypothetical protein ACQEPW_005435 [Xanthomonas oryzae pv. oryzicola]|uniref:hypothetical protein n=1 Tax=Xanthomonas oryzae TaxID=347 RepID=UPI003D171074